METKNLPLERHEALVSFSREHHHVLLLSWKIRKGLNSKIPHSRIKKYSDWFYKNYVKNLFEDEEYFLFPILGEEHKLIKKVLSEHRRLTRLFNESSDLEKALHNLEEELDRNIRFKERELFRLIQDVATAEQLESILQNRKPIPFSENEKDKFWG